LHCFILQIDATFTLAKTISLISGKTEWTMREWKATFLVNNGALVFPDNLAGKHQRSTVLWHNEDLNKQGIKYVRENNGMKGKPNMTLCSLCHWINDSFYKVMSWNLVFVAKLD